ncbi:element excision factor XisH family protein [Aphanizomenon sp. CS-733/32]|nr:element excision factor XisH family protein [Aphanizomenon sp. CS-733/32]MDB9309358.1 element excision factor XisH family protein [Aphanizomenon sp. CS-733/32]
MYDYDEFFSRKFIQRIIGEYDLKLLIFNPDQEEIVMLNKPKT